MKSLDDVDFWAEASALERAREGIWAYVSLISNTIAVTFILWWGAWTTFNYFNCFFILLAIVCLTSVEVVAADCRKEAKARDERERLRQQQREAKALREDTSSLGYQILSRYVDLGNDDTVFAPLVAIDMENLTDTQTRILDEYFESAKQIEATFTDMGDEVSDYGRQILHTCAASVMGDLHQDKVTQELLAQPVNFGLKQVS